MTGRGPAGRAGGKIRVFEPERVEQLVLAQRAEGTRGLAREIIRVRVGDERV